MVHKLLKTIVKPFGNHRIKLYYDILNFLTQKILYEAT